MADEDTGKVVKVDEAAIAAQVNERVAKVNGLVGKGQLKQALTEGLANSQPLCLSKVDAVKALSSKAVIGALKAAAVKDIKGLVVGLSADEADVAMKHVFKGMESQEGCERLLEWHGQLFDKFGIGCIVRAINERSPCPEAVIQ